MIASASGFEVEELAGQRALQVADELLNDRAAQLVCVSRGGVQSVVPGAANSFVAAGLEEFAGVVKPVEGTAGAEYTTFDVYLYSFIASGLTAFLTVAIREWWWLVIR